MTHDDVGVLNLGLLIKGVDAEYFTVAAWLPMHDNLLRELLSSPDLKLRPEKRYTTTGRQGSVHLVADASERVFVAITRVGYPSRVAHILLDDLQDKMLLSPHNSASLVASQPHELSKPLQALMDSLVDKYDDPADVDAMTSVQGKLDVTTSTMQENITLLLENDAKLSEIEGKADAMTDQSAKFKANSKSLKDKMWWKLCKMRICYGLIALSLLAIIIVPMSLQANATNAAVDASSGGGDGGTTTIVHVHGDDDRYWESTHNNAHENSFRGDDASMPEQKASETEEDGDEGLMQNLFSTLDADPDGFLSLEAMQAEIEASSPEVMDQLEGLLNDNQDGGGSEVFSLESLAASYGGSSSDDRDAQTPSLHSMPGLAGEGGEQKAAAGGLLLETTYGSTKKGGEKTFKPSLATIPEEGGEQKAALETPSGVNKRGEKADFKPSLATIPEEGSAVE